MVLIVFDNDGFPVGMYDISTNSLEPIKRQEKELKIFYESSDELSDEGNIKEMLGSFDDHLGKQNVSKFIQMSNNVNMLSIQLTEHSLIFYHNSLIIAASSNIHPTQINNVMLFSEETLAAANIITAFSALIVGILLGVLISKRCLNPESAPVNGSGAKKLGWPSRTDHNCKFYIQR